MKNYASYVNSLRQNIEKTGKIIADSSKLAKIYALSVAVLGLAIADVVTAYKGGWDKKGNK